MCKCADKHFHTLCLCIWWSAQVQAIGRRRLVGYKDRSGASLKTDFIQLRPQSRIGFWTTWTSELKWSQLFILTVGSQYNSYLPYLSVSTSSAGQVAHRSVVQLTRLVVLSVALLSGGEKAIKSVKIAKIRLRHYIDEDDQVSLTKSHRVCGGGGGGKQSRDLKIKISKFSLQKFLQIFRHRFSSGRLAYKILLLGLCWSWPFSGIESRKVLWF